MTMIPPEVAHPNQATFHSILSALPPHSSKIRFSQDMRWLQLQVCLIVTFHFSSVTFYLHREYQNTVSIDSPLLTYDFDNILSVNIFMNLCELKKSGKYISRDSASCSTCGFWLGDAIKIAHFERGLLPWVCKRVNCLALVSCELTKSSAISKTRVKANILFSLIARVRAPHFSFRFSKGHHKMRLQDCVFTDQPNFI